MRALDLDRTEVVTLECDREEPKTRFTIRPLSASELARCKDEATTYEVPRGGLDDGEALDARFNPNKSQYEVAKRGLVGIEPWTDRHGSPIEFKKGKSIDQLPLEAVRELAAKVEELSDVPADEAKA